MGFLYERRPHREAFAAFPKQNDKCPPGGIHRLGLHWAMTSPLLPWGCIALWIVHNFLVFLSIFLSSWLVQLVISAPPSEVLLLLLSFLFLSLSSINRHRHYYYLFYREPAERICLGLMIQSYSMENLNGKQWAPISYLVKFYRAIDAV